MGANQNESEEKREELTPRKRPDITTGTTTKIITGCGNLYITVNWDNHGICEVFAALGKSGGCMGAHLEAIGRLISISLRASINVEKVIKMLKGIRCPSIAWEEGKAILSCADAIGTVLEQHRKGFQKIDSEFKPNITDMPCPECGNFLVYQEGCYICQSCGYTKCD